MLTIRQFGEADIVRVESTAILAVDSTRTRHAPDGPR
jgi:hypothetical protein